MNSFNRLALSSLLFITIIYGRAFAQQATDSPSTQPAVSQNENTTGTETIVLFRHGEKPPHGLGQISPQGLNRALALSTVLPQKLGKPDFLFAPDPAQKVYDGKIQFNYVRPLATIEPLAIRLQMPVITPCGYREIDKLIAELDQPKYSNAMIFIAWEHEFAGRAAQKLVKSFGGDQSTVPDWPGPDYDSLYIVKITRTPDHTPTVKFIHDQENLNNQSKEMPTPAEK